MDTTRRVTPGRLRRLTEELLEEQLGVIERSSVPEALVAIQSALAADQPEFTIAPFARPIAGICFSPDDRWLFAYDVDGAGGLFELVPGGEAVVGLQHLQHQRHEVEPPRLGERHQVGQHPGFVDDVGVGEPDIVSGQGGGAAQAGVERPQLAAPAFGQLFAQHDLDVAADGAGDVTGAVRAGVVDDDDGERARVLLARQRLDVRRPRWLSPPRAA